ncbi:hypothetical protein I543_1134 [Mycobacteroides abscessus 21]|uniref:Uncharacterized protein n=1 Tax=Mycobacteroides abscessus 21 TaxID=1299324 RepID=A0A829PW83_9MYCO|nr:hypothetical protein I543_1134 [Mycobacteroides abscessus 21]
MATLFSAMAGPHGNGRLNCTASCALFIARNLSVVLVHR